MEPLANSRNPMWGDRCGRVEVRRGASGQLPEPNVGRCRGRVEVRRGASGQLPYRENAPVLKADW